MAESPAEESVLTRPPAAGPTVALWTPHGRSAVATIKVCGDLSPLLQAVDGPIPFRAANGKPLIQQPIGRIVFGNWGVAPSEDVVVCRIGDQELEIHCHGGLAAARRIMADWVDLHCEIVDWTVQSRQLIGRLATDCRVAMARATTLRTASILLDQELAWREFLNRVLSCANTGAWSELQAEVERALSWRELGRHLLEPFRVVLTGPPNVGKSALLNALVGYQRSVVFDQPGTTRDVVTAETAFAGWPVRLIDTAGLRDNATGLEAAGIELAQGQLAEADLVLQVQDVTQEDESESTSGVRSTTKTIHVVNKTDLVTGTLSILPQYPGAIAVSARTGAGIDHLITEIAEHLVPQSPTGGTLIPFWEYQCVWLEKLSEATEQRSAMMIQGLVGAMRSDENWQFDIGLY